MWALPRDRASRPSSIVRGVLSREPNSRFFLFYGNKSTGDILFREQLEELKDASSAASPSSMSSPRKSRTCPF